MNWFLKGFVNEKISGPNDVDGSEDEIVDWLDSLGITAE